MNFISGGICAPKGFSAGGIHVGVKVHNTHKKDLALILSDRICTSAAIYTKNQVKAAHIFVDMLHLEDGHAIAAIINSGNANACAPNDIVNANRICNAVALAIGCNPNDVIIASTGVIGQEIRVDAIEKGIPILFSSISADETGSDAAAHAIMTTDTAKKEFAVETNIAGRTVRIGGIAKGSGMIHPNMGTMLCFITTDCNISSKMLDVALREVSSLTFNRISVDGDTSTNDTCCILANGMAENPLIADCGHYYDNFLAALRKICTKFAISMASDGEGAKHLITCNVARARNEEDAELLAKSIISSTLTKAAIFGCDANWGRVLCAMGYSGVQFNPALVSIAFKSQVGEIKVCKNGTGIEFDEEFAKKILSEHDIEINVDMSSGNSKSTCWGCDITYDYIKINGDYRT